MTFWVLICKPSLAASGPKVRDDHRCLCPASSGPPVLLDACCGWAELELRIYERESRPAGRCLERALHHLCQTAEWLQVWGRSQYRVGSGNGKTRPKISTTSCGKHPVNSLLLGHTFSPRRPPIDELGIVFKVLFLLFLWLKEPVSMLSGRIPLDPLLFPSFEIDNIFWVKNRGFKGFYCFQGRYNVLRHQKKNIGKP